MTIAHDHPTPSLPSTFRARPPAAAIASVTRRSPAFALSFAALTAGAAASSGDPPAAPPADRAVYRCGDSYSARPCGDAPPLDVADPRTEAQRRQGEDAAASEKRLAAALAAQRRAREAPPAATPVRTIVLPACRGAPATASAPACSGKPARPRRSRALAAAQAASGLFTSKAAKGTR